MNNYEISTFTKGHHVKFQMSEDCLSETKLCLNQDLDEFKIYKESKCTDCEEGFDECDIYYDYEDSYENYKEYKNYGDGVDTASFSNIKSSFFSLISATNPYGKRSAAAVEFLVSVLGVCNEGQRQELMALRKDGHYPLSMASELGDLDIIKFFVEQCRCDTSGICGGQTMMWAVLNSRFDILQYMIDNGADIGTHVHKNNLLTVALLIHFDECDEHENNFVFPHFKYKVSLDMVRYLIQKEAVKHSSQNSLFKCLTHCIERDYGIKPNLYNECFKMLLGRIDDVDNIRGENGCTLLGYAIQFNKVDLTKQLIAMGANINITKMLKFDSLQDLRVKDTDPIDSIVNSLLSSLTTEENIEQKDMNENENFVHPIVFTAGNGNTEMLQYFLHLSQIDFRDKLDALEILGAYFALKMRPKDAKQCWKACVKFRHGNVVSSKTSSASKDTLESMNQADFDDDYGAHNSVSTSTECVEPNMSKEQSLDSNDTSDNNENHSDSEGNDINLDMLDAHYGNGFPLHPPIYDSDNSMDSNNSFDLDFGLDFPVFKNKIPPGELIELLTKCYNSFGCQMPPKKVADIRRPVFRHHLEFQSMQDLQNINPDDYINLLIQCTLLYERLFGYSSEYLMKVFFNLARQYKKEGYLEQYSSVLIYVLVHFQKNYETSAYGSNPIFVAIRRLIYIVSGESRQGQYNVSTVILTAKLILIQLVTYRRLQKVTTIGEDEMTGLLFLIDQISRANKSDVECIDFRLLLKAVVHFDFRDVFGQSLLHLASLVRSKQGKDRASTERHYGPRDEYKTAMFRGGSCMLANILLSFGADANSRDNNGATPLHAIFMTLGNGDVSYEHHEIIKGLIDAGAHLDMIDCRGKSPIDYSESTNYPLCPVKYRNLQCLSSSVVIRYHISYYVDLPQNLISYVELHKTRFKTKERSRRHQKLQGHLARNQYERIYIR